MQLQNRSDKEETDQLLERASLQELRVRRTSPVPDARDAYDELRQATIKILCSEIGWPHLNEGVGTRAFIQAQLDDILRHEQIILNRRERRRLTHDIIAELLRISETVAQRMPDITTANLAPLESFFAEANAGRGSDLLQAAVVNRRNILIAGKSGAGKKALLQTLCNLLPPDEYVITIEETAELRLDHPHVVSLRRREPDLGQKNDVSAHTLIQAAARTRSHRLVLDSLQGAEAYAWLQAVNAGQRGSIATCLALSPQDALARIEAMARQAEAVSAEVIRGKIERAIDLIVYVEQATDGLTSTASINEITGLEKGQFMTASIV